jgi:hypothetical protein
MTLVDTNVILDVATDDAKWANWSLRQLDAAAMRGPVLINATINILDTLSLPAPDLTS